MKLKYIALVPFLCSAYCSFAQGSAINIGSEVVQTLERAEAFQGHFSDQLFTTVKGIDSRLFTAFAQVQKNNIYASKLSNRDMFELNNALNVYDEWVYTYGSPSYLSSNNNRYKPFYNNPAHLIETNTPKFYAAFDPIIGLQIANDNNKTYGTNLSYTVGARYRMRVSDWMSGEVSYRYNDEVLESKYYNRVNGFEALPNSGVTGFNANNHYQYSQVRGQVNFLLLKDVLNFGAGYGHHFIGDGYRSLMMSDYSNAAWYAKFQLQIWKLNYQTIYSKYDNQSIYKGYSGAATQHKYGVTHHLSVNVMPWLNIGVFESVMFGRSNGYELAYLNPIIFYRSVERSMGSPDKILVGINAKAIPVKSVKVYGQFVLNEFSGKEFFASNGYWANKWGGQLGVNYYDAFGISNLDIQLEGNVVRPYTYSSNVKADGEILANYANGNLALAHPLGAGFREGIFSVKYRPGLRWTVDARAMYYQQGVDFNLDSLSYGSNILKNYDSRSANYGVKMLNGPVVNTLVLNANVGYQLLPSTFLELGATFKQQKSGNSSFSQNNVYSYLSIRMNMNRRDYAVH